MKPLLGLALLVLAPPQTLQVARAYKVGDVDAYHITMKMEGAMAMQMTMDSSQKVVSVYDNGDADIETTTTDAQIDMMGMKRPLPGGPPAKMRVTKFGTPVGGTKAAGRAMGMDFSKYVRQLPKGEMKVGQTVPFDETDAEAKTHATGTTKLESVTDGVGKYVTSMDVLTEGATKPMHLDFTSLVDGATGRPKHIDGKITNLDGAPGMPKGMPITSITLTMDRKA